VLRRLLLSNVHLGHSSTSGCAPVRVHAGVGTLSTLATPELPAALKDVLTGEAAVAATCSWWHLVQPGGTGACCLCAALPSARDQEEQSWLRTGTSGSVPPATRCTHDTRCIQYSNYMSQVALAPLGTLPTTDE
jgi:hypothetical protein